MSSLVDDAPGSGPLWARCRRAGRASWRDCSEPLPAWQKPRSGRQVDPGRPRAFAIPPSLSGVCRRNCQQSPYYSEHLSNFISWLKISGQVANLKEWGETAISRSTMSAVLRFVTTWPATPCGAGDGASPGVARAVRLGRDAAHRTLPQVLAKTGRQPTSRKAAGDDVPAAVMKRMAMKSALTEWSEVQPYCSFEAIRARRGFRDRPCRLRRGTGKPFCLSAPRDAMVVRAAEPNPDRRGRGRSIRTLTERPSQRGGVHG